MHKEIKWAEDREKRKINKALKVAKHRPFKNFLIWFSGFLFCLIFLAGSAFLVLKLIPLKSILGEDNEYVSEEVAQDSLFDAILNFDKYQFKDVPILFDVIDNAMKDAGINEFISINFDGLKEVGFTSPDLMTEIGENIEVIATIESLGGVEILGDLGKISAFTEVEKVPEEDYPDETGTSFNAKLYYYNDGTNYVRAFTDEHVRVDGAIGKDLYYPALKDVKILECVDIISERFGESTVGSLLSVFAEMDSDSMIMKIVGDKKIKDMGEITAESILLTDVMDYTSNKQLFHIILDVKGETDYTKYNTLTLKDVMGLDTNKIKLTSVMQYEGNQTLYSILCDATSKSSYEDITVGDLSNFNMDNVKLSSVIPYKLDENNDGVFEVDNSELYAILCDANSLENTETNRNLLTINSVKNIKTESIKLSTVLKYEGNQTLYSILCDATSKSNYEDITVGDLNEFSTDTISLNSVLPYSENASLYKILMDVANETDYTKLTLKSIKDFNTDNIHLHNVLDYEGNKEIFAVLCDATEKENYKDITISSLSNFNLSRIYLSHILPYEEDVDKDGIIDKTKGDVDNKDIYQILCDATGIVGYQNLKVENLSNFKHETIKLSSVLPYVGNEDIYKILVDATNKTSYEDLTLEDLTRFDKLDIKLSSVLGNDTGDTGNPILDKLLEDETVTLGNIASKLNDLTFLEVYPDVSECFSTSMADGNCTKPYYKTVNGDYYLQSEFSITTIDGVRKITLEDGTEVEVKDGDYYVKRNALIYFLYDFEDDDIATPDFASDGHAVRWVHRDIKVSNLSGFGDAASHMEKATIRMLEDTGVLDHEDFFESENWYPLTLNQVMDEIKELVSLAP